MKIVVSAEARPAVRVITQLIINVAEKRKSH